MVKHHSIPANPEWKIGGCCHRQLTTQLLGLSKSLDLPNCKRRDNRWKLQTDGEAQSNTETIIIIVIGNMHSTLGTLPLPLPCFITRETKAQENRPQSCKGQDSRCFSLDVWSCLQISNSVRDTWAPYKTGGKRQVIPETH